MFLLYSEHLSYTFYSHKRETVYGVASSYFSKESGVWIAFSPKTVPEPRRITCYSWSHNAVLVPLEDDETLVSSVIQLECDDPAGVNFTGITLALSHSAVESKEYELVMKELINLEKRTWKDLKTPRGMLPFMLTNKKEYYRALLNIDME